MKKYFLYFILFSSFVLLTGCPGAIDSMTWKELGDDYIYHESAGLPCIEKEHSDKGIPGVIFSYNNDEKFIIAIEKFILLSEQEKTKLISEDKYYDLLLEKGITKYWIIYKTNDSIYGPFDRQEYLQKREELGVPRELQLKEE
ncbi:MAG: DUF3997 domain-containing protein [Nitrosomonadaceae bacterium]|nr:DUF3997 domain-containing protein [Nitrosomonadaceae bacterium]